MAARMMALVMAIAMAFMPIVAASEEHPMEKVVNLLKKLSDQVVEEGQNEEVSFEKFKYWCSTSASELEKAIEEEKATIDELESKIDSYKEQKKELEDQIKELEDEIKEMQADAKAAKEKDAKRNKAYVDTKKDLKDTIKSVGEAITALKNAGEKTSLLSVHEQTVVRKAVSLVSAKATDEQKAVLETFGRPKQLAEGDLSKHVEKYKFKSDSVIDLLKGLKLKFQDDLTAADTEETNAANEYALAKQARDTAEKAADKSKSQKEGMLADVKSSLAEAEGDLKDEKADLKADTDTLDKTKTTCKTKTEEWDERSETRANELEAMKKAIEILGEVSGVRTEAPSNPTLPTSPVKFLQVVDPKSRAVQLLRETAKTTHSKALERLAMEVSNHLTGPFDKVNDMIQKMIIRLMAEQTDEDKHKAWCDVELDKSKQTKSDKKDKIKDLNLKIKEANAKVAKLTNEITDADKMIADVTAFMAEAVEIREAGKQENKISIKDAKLAQESVAKAVAVLEAHYKSSGEIAKEPWEFIQEPVKLPKDPKLWDSSYTGVTDPKKGGTGVIAILEKIGADFSKMEAETKAQEVTDQKKFDETMQTHAVEKKRRQEESTMKSDEKKRLLDKVTAFTTAKKHATDELDAVEQYLKDLKPACLDGDSSYEDRKKARAQEIKGLKDAKKLLKDAFKDVKKASFLAVNRHDTLA